MATATSPPLAGATLRAQTPNATRPGDRPERPTGRAATPWTPCKEFADDHSTRLLIVDAAAGEVLAGDLPTLSPRSTGLVIVPDHAMASRTSTGGRLEDTKKTKPYRAATASADRSAPARLDLRRRRRPVLWPSLPARTRRAPPAGRPLHRVHRSPGSTHRAAISPPHPRAGGPDDLPAGELAGDGRGHGTFVAGLAAGVGSNYAGAAPGAGDRLARRDGRPGHGAHERRDRGRPVDPQEPSRVRHPGRELLAPLRDPHQLPLGPARQGGREALVRGRRRRGCLRQPGPGRPADADGVRARERPVRDHGRRARPPQLDQSRPRGRGAVVDLGIHARRLRQARADAPRPRRSGRPGSRGVDARRRAPVTGHPYRPTAPTWSLSGTLALGARSSPGSRPTCSCSGRRSPRTRSRAP